MSGTMISVDWQWPERWVFEEEEARLVWRLVVASARAGRQLTTEEIDTALEVSTPGRSR